MKTVAIIAEYNPFHYGHEYQIKKIREDFGPDTRIIAIMSGNFTQRGEIAIIDKYTRAECAVKCGVNLVLELPFPFSSSSAEYFALSGVKIANSLPNIDYLSFGSECGDVNLLTQIAENMLTSAYTAKLKSNSQKMRGIGCVKSSIEAYNELFDTKLSDSFFSPNNILAIEYIKALKKMNSKIAPHTFRRLGSGYSETSILGNRFESATAIRGIMRTNIDTALNYIPKSAKEVLISAKQEFPTDVEQISSAIIASLRLSECAANIHDAGGGLNFRLHKNSFEVSRISDLVSISDTKKYTTARIRRAILNSYFGVTSSDVVKLPMYSQLLAADKVGQEILKENKKHGKIDVLTKPSSKSKLSEIGAKQKSLSDKADSIFQLTKPAFVNGNFTVTRTPFIVK